MRPRGLSDPNRPAFTQFRLQDTRLVAENRRDAGPGGRRRLHTLIVPPARLAAPRPHGEN
jgi:hypothetical protein